MKNTLDINRYDFTKMIKDFEANERSQNIKQRLKKKYQEENKKYQLNIEHMKELREQNYIQRNTDLRNRLKKKRKFINNKLRKYKIK